MNVYERLGIRTLINARGTHSVLGGSIPSPEVFAAMAEASQHFVELSELQRAAGKVIARVTGAEAGYVTGSAAAGILLATAACIAGPDPARLYRLPDTTGMRDEIVVHRSQRHSYDNQACVAGGRFVEIGLTSSTQEWELESAIGDRTAAVFYTVSPLLRSGFLPLEDVIRIAHARGIPVYVDAASMLPPAENLRRFIAMGADLVIFSGGKGLHGPQPSGILAGRADLVEAARLSGSPYRGVGRGSKVSREQIVGLLTALEIYVQRDHAADQARWHRQVETVVRAVQALDLPGVTATVVDDPERVQLPEAHLHFRPGVAERSAAQVGEELMAGDPRVATDRQGNTLIVNPQMLAEGQEAIIAERLVALLHAPEIGVGT
ncbi:MAG: aminotransferase class V-fold PLP-dependent enzyme [Chloroflexi bacterium]|nr:aminotransferase class V-fold PLP-dependent enzyme [Chloroflexota bacterium]